MSDTTSMDMSLNESSDGVDMTRPATVLSREHVYQGAIFGVEDMRIALQTRDGGQTVIRRQVMRHAPCVVMLVHDCAQDLYLVEREYRVGCDAFAYGLPAGLIDDGEDVDAAALRELREETGVEPIDENSCDIDHVGQFYSSEGMTDEQRNKFNKDDGVCFNTEVIYINDTYALQLGNPQMINDVNQAAVNCLKRENVAPKGYTKKLFEQDEKNRLQDEHTELNYSDPKVQSCLAALGITTMESDKVWRPAKTSS